MLKWLLIFIIIVILVLIYFYNVINQNEDKALYYPSKKCVWKPKYSYKTVFMNVNDRKDICYSSKDKKKNEEYISGWHFGNFKGKKTVIFSHGTSIPITIKNNKPNKHFVKNFDFLNKKFKKLN